MKNLIDIELPNKLTFNGIVVGIVSIAMVGSISSTYRISAGGLLIHPYLFLLALGVLMTNWKILRIKKDILNPAIYFILIMSASLIQELDFAEMIKIISGFVTFVFFFQTIKSENDFYFASIGFILVSFIVSNGTFVASETDFNLNGVNSLEGFGNKNAQSLFTLPGLFFLCFLLKGVVKKYWWLFVIWAAIMLTIIMGIIYAGNRSGYLGIFIIVALTIYINFKQSFSTVLVLIVSIGLLVQIGMNNADISKLLTHKFNQTTSSYGSDNLRTELLKHSFLLGLQNPVLGLGKDDLMIQLADRAYPVSDKVDPHNLYGYILGGAGVFAFVIFFYWLFILYKKVRQQRRLRKYFKLNNNYIDYWALAFLLLFLTRAAFTREILYSPTFMGGLGLMFGLVRIYHLRQSIALTREVGSHKQ